MNVFKPELFGLGNNWPGNYEFEHSVINRIIICEEKSLEIYVALKEIYSEKANNMKHSDIMNKGNVYRICALLLRYLPFVENKSSKINYERLTIIREVL